MIESLIATKIRIIRRIYAVNVVVFRRIMMEAKILRNECPPGYSAFDGNK
jgi:hypothetical protein